MSGSIPMKTPATLHDAQRRSLRRVAAMMIPASEAYGVPGADDEAIFADVVRSLGRDADAVRAALGRLDELAGGTYADRTEEEQRAAAQRLREGDAALAAVLATVVARCYYRDDRVMRSLGMEPRPPFPKGFDVEQGDWSLLDPVRARGRIWRDAP
jgi:hypothetical protein